MGFFSPREQRSAYKLMHTSVGTMTSTGSFNFLSWLIPREIIFFIQWLQDTGILRHNENSQLIAYPLVYIWFHLLSFLLAESHWCLFPNISLPSILIIVQISFNSTLHKVIDTKFKTELFFEIYIKCFWEELIETSYTSKLLSN